MNLLRNLLGHALTAALAVPLLPCLLHAQVDHERAQAYFQEAAELCEREAGQIWGVPLHGPMIVADVTTNSFASNQPVPEEARPKFLGYANTAAQWGDQRWSTFVWQMIPKDDADARARMMMHELFHRVQPQLGLLIKAMPGSNDHLDGLEGRFWMQLEWRALAKALAANRSQSLAAISDAMSFREARRQRFVGSAASEQASEINEGLAQYTGTKTAYSTREAVVADAIEQLNQAAMKETFVLTFAYATGAAYGLLLDEFSPGWTRHIKASDDVGQLLIQAAGIESLADPELAKLKYGGPDLWVAEQEREQQRLRRVAELRSRFVEGPVLALPRGKNAVFITLGVTPIPGAGTVYPSYRVSGRWGQIEADLVLVSTDGQTLTVPAPFDQDGETLSGAGWQATLNPGWALQPGQRQGDTVVFQVAQDP